jgi:hypothetical protein
MIIYGDRPLSNRSRERLLSSEPAIPGGNQEFVDSDPNQPKTREKGPIDALVEMLSCIALMHLPGGCWNDDFP